MVIRIVDIETTGTDPETDAIVEIASVDMVSGGGITNAMATLVGPGRPIPPSASAVHHLIDEDVVEASPLTEAITQFLGADWYVAHNAAFEQGFLSKHLGEPKAWICTYKCALRLWPDAESHGNQFLRYNLGLASPFGIPRDRINPHRAASDVIVTAAILEKMLAMAKWSDLVTWSNQPALHTRLHFGKHRGERYDAVDPSYLSWIVEKSDLDEGVKYSAAHWLGAPRSSTNT